MVNRSTGSDRVVSFLFEAPRALTTSSTPPSVETRSSTPSVEDATRLDMEAAFGSTRPIRHDDDRTRCGGLGFFELSNTHGFTIFTLGATPLVAHPQSHICRPEPHLSVVPSAVLAGPVHPRRPSRLYLDSTEDLGRP